MRYRWVALVLLLVIVIVLTGCCDSMEKLDVYKEGRTRSDSPWPKRREGFADPRLDTLDTARRYFEQATEDMPDKHHNQQHIQSRLFRLLVAVYLQNQAILRDLGREWNGVVAHAREKELIQKEREKIWNEIAGTDLRLKEEELIEATERYFIGDDFIEDLKEFSNWYGKRIKDDILAIICLP